MATATSTESQPTIMHRVASMRLGLKIVISGAVVTGAAAAVIATAPSPEDNSLDASRIIPSLSNPQQAADKVPAAVMTMLDPGLKLDPSQTRLLGKVDTVTYYGVAAGDKICMVPVDATGKDNGFIGCTLLKSFESGGLKFENAERTEAAWLIAPAAAAKALGSVKSEAGWSQQAPNFLVRNNK
ncbi:hypothetical protein BJG92_01268 [Arthrobacter sp. SO5]|nr:hypothetical protein [Arthrobacter sp. SO5]